MEIANHPPRPRLALRVGVSGHREIDESKITQIRIELGSAFSVLDRTIDQIASKYASYFAEEPPLKRLISPLAEGADTLAANVAQAHGYAIQSPLPFTVGEYRKDFSEEKAKTFDRLLQSADSVFELDGVRDGDGAADASYLATGHLTLRQSDLLLAIWDGKAARGIGGTAMIVEAAVQRGIPVIWIHSEGAAAPCLLRSDLTAGLALDEIATILIQALAPPFLSDSATVRDGFNVRSKRGADEFFVEVQRRFNFGILFQLFQSLITLQWPHGLVLYQKKYVQSTEEDWSEFAKVVGGVNPEVERRVEAALGPRFSWADGLANYYAAIYRSSYVLNYVVGAFAVLLALSGLILDVNRELCNFLEVTAILAILSVTTTGQRRRWHERWIDYRQLAEQLRHLRFLYLTGGASSNLTSLDKYESGSSEGGWVQWYYQATMREMGLAPVCATPGYIVSIKDLFLKEEIKSQVEYHRRNARRMHTLEHSLHRLGDVLFILASVVCASYVAISLIAKFEWMRRFAPGEAVEGWVTFVSAFFPALGAAMSGIRVQGEFSSTADRSEAMAARLTQLQRELHTAETGLAKLRSFIETTAETMLIEVVDWRFVFRTKPLSLPA